MSFTSDVDSWYDAIGGGEVPLDLHVTCMKEEWEELADALDSGDRAAIAKEAADLIWNVLGVAVVAHGIDFDRVWRAVRESNWSKIGPNGELVKREDGKIIKPPGYEPPDLAFVGRVSDG